MRLDLADKLRTTGCARTDGRDSSRVHPSLYLKQPLLGRFSIPQPPLSTVKGEGSFWGTPVLGVPETDTKTQNSVDVRRRYFKDPLNFLDSFLVVLPIVDLYILAPLAGPGSKRGTRMCPPILRPPPRQRLDNLEWGSFSVSGVMF